MADYSPHHDPFQYYKSTANPKHLPPSSEAAIGHTDQANHQYDLSRLLHHAQGRQHAGRELPQGRRVPGRATRATPTRSTSSTSSSTRSTRSRQSRYWKSTAIVITYDDSDGWYDHQNSPRVNGSDTAEDAAVCASSPRCDRRAPGPVRLRPAAAAAGHLPVHAGRTTSATTLTDQSSVVKFIEDNWRPRPATRPRVLRPDRGQPGRAGAPCWTSTSGRSSSRSCSTRPAVRSSATGTTRTR